MTRDAEQLEQLFAWLDQLQVTNRTSEIELIEARGMRLSDFDRIVRRDVIGRRHNEDASVRDAPGRGST
jgi:hypothetical protein